MNDYLIELRVTEYQRELLIEALGELYDKYDVNGNMLIKPDDIMLNDYKLQNIDVLSQYIRTVDKYD